MRQLKSGKRVLVWLKGDLDIMHAIGSVENLETSLEKVTGIVNLSIHLECKLSEITDATVKLNSTIY